MKIVNYQFEEKYLNEYFSLINKIYSEYPHVAKDKILEAKKNLNTQNPFFDFGKVENFLLFDDDEVKVHLSIILDDRLPDGIGVFSHFEAVNSMEYIESIYRYVKKYLLNNKINKLVGPINISTWQNFRISFDEINKPYFLEPFNRGYYKKLLDEIGFNLVQGNITKYGHVEKQNFDKFKENYDSMIKAGFRFVSLTKDNFLDSLEKLYDVAKKIFPETWLYVDISKKEFKYNYSDYNKLVDRCLITYVENKSGDVVAFYFAVPDIYSNEKVLVIKTMGVAPEYQGKGIGGALFYSIHKKSRKQGFEKYIFSTMEKNNRKIQKLTYSDNIYREYGVFEINVND